MNPYDFTDHFALVTGASARMGLAAAEAFATAGAATVLLDRDEAAVHAATAELASAGHQVHAILADVSNEDQVAAAVAEMVGRYGRLDFAFNSHRRRPSLPAPHPDQPNRQPQDPHHRRGTGHHRPDQRAPSRASNVSHLIGSQTQ